jgi:hypothetical protein
VPVAEASAVVRLGTPVEPVHRISARHGVMVTGGAATSRCRGET